MRLFFLLLLTIVTSGLEAKVYRLAVITSEFDNDKTNYFLETDERNTIVNMRYVTVQPNGGIYEDVTLPAERVISEGAVLVERDGLVAVRLEVENFDLKSGGVIKLNYLFNGVIGVRHVKKLMLKEVDGEFSLYNEDERVNRLFLEANRSRILGIIGIKAVLTSFVPNSVDLQ